MKYTFIKQLGIGGYGQVWLVRDEFGRFRALKKLLRRAADVASELRQEAVKLFQLRGAPGVVQLVDHNLDCEDPFIVMELADGTLRERLNGPLPAAQAAAIAYHLARAVHEAHARGIVHRDIKPENIFVKGQNLALGDFGLGKGAESLLLTVGGAGTPGYMAPEQATGPAFAESDVYGVGATLFELLTGMRPPADRTSLDPRWYVPCSAQLAELVISMTSPSPYERPTLPQVQASLAALLNQSVPMNAVPAPVPAGPSLGDVAVAGLIGLGVVGLLGAIFGGGKGGK
jgi:serine/threonine protein kinase